MKLSLRTQMAAALEDHTAPLCFGAEGTRPRSHRGSAAESGSVSKNLDTLYKELDPRAGGTGGPALCPAPDDLAAAASHA